MFLQYDAVSWLVSETRSWLRSQSLKM